MKTYKQLKEAISNFINKGDAKGLFNLKDFNKTKSWSYSDTPVSKTESGHIIHKIKHREHGDNVTYYATHPNTKNKIHIIVGGREKNGVFEEHVLRGNKSTLKTHDFYHHLLKHHVNAIVGDNHSPGAMKAWERLSKHPKVNVHGWLNGKPINIKMGDDETHVGGEYGVPKNLPDSEKIAKMKLVAHLK